MRKITKDSCSIRMNRPFVSGLLIAGLVLILLCAGSSFGATQNLISDPYFKTMPISTVSATGAVGDWRFISADGAAGNLTVTAGSHNGIGRTATLNRTNTTGSLSIDMNDLKIPAVSGHTYRLSFWAKTTSTTSQTITGTAGAFDASNTWLKNIGTTTFTPTSDWTLYAIEFTAPDDTAYLNPIFQLDTEGSVNISDVCLMDKVASSVLNSDPGFDSIPAGTSYTVDGTYALSSDWTFVSTDQAGGTFSLITGRDGTGQASHITRSTTTGWVSLVTPYVPVVAGKNYQFTLWVKSSAGTKFLPVIGTFDSNKTYIKNLLWAAPQASSGWTKYSYAFTAEANCAYAQIQMILPNGDSSFIGNVDVDDIKLEDLSLKSIDNIVADPDFDSIPTDTIYTAEGAYIIGDWRFVHGGGYGGSLTAVTPGHDGTGRAMKITKSAASGYAWVDTDQSRIPVVAGHRYLVSIWAKTTETTQQVIGTGIPWFDNTNAYISASAAGFAINSNWTQCSFECVAPAGTAFISPQIHLDTVGSALFDDAKIVDVTLNTISGGVGSTLSGPASGVSVSLQSLCASNNLLQDPTFEDCVVGTTWNGTGNDGSTIFDCWSFFSYGANATVSIISPGQNGSNAAVRITRNATGPTDAGLRQEPGIFEPVFPGHTYRIGAWLRSSDTTPSATLFRIECYDASGNWLDNRDYNCTPTSTWAQYLTDVVIPDGAAYASFTVRYMGVGSVDLDNLSVRDITPCFTTTTNTSGLYSFSVFPGFYAVTAVQNGSRIDPIIDTGTSLSAADLYAMPNPIPSWSVTDTFTRPNSSSLGTTEDSYAIPWVGNDKSNANIADGQLQLPYNIASNGNNGVFLGHGFMPDDFDMSVDLYLVDIEEGDWFAVVYRQSAIGTANSGAGYVAQIWLWELEERGFSYPVANLWHNGSGTPVTNSGDLSGYINYGGLNRIQVSAHGNEHKLTLNDHVVYDVIDTTSGATTAGGYLGFLADRWLSVAWDNFSASYTAPVIIDVEGSAAYIKSNAQEGDTVKVNDAIVTGVYDGFFYIEDTSRISGIKVVSNESVSLNQVITSVQGTFGIVNGEKQITATDVTKGSISSIKPLGAAGKGAVSDGLSTLGLLVRVWGKVTHVGSGFCYIDDGSGISDGSEYTGIRVITTGLGTINANHFYKLTGVLGKSATGYVIYPQTSTSMVE